MLQGRVRVKYPSVVRCDNSVFEIIVMETVLQPDVPSHLCSPTFFMRCVLGKQLGTKRQQFDPGCSLTINSSPFSVISQTPLYPVQMNNNLFENSILQIFELDRP